MISPRLFSIQHWWFFWVTIFFFPTFIFSSTCCSAPTFACQRKELVKHTNPHFYLCCLTMWCFSCEVFFIVKEKSWRKSCYVKIVERGLWRVCNVTFIWRVSIVMCEFTSDWANWSFSSTKLSRKHGFRTKVGLNEDVIKKLNFLTRFRLYTVKKK